MASLVGAGISFLVFVVVAMVITGWNPLMELGREPLQEGEVRPCTLQPGEIQKENREYCPEYDVSKIELFVLQFTNEERVNHGLASLKNDKKLANIAREHSADMINREYYGHDAPGGLGPSDRAENAGYTCIKNYGTYYTDGVGENIHVVPTKLDYYSGGFYSHERLASLLVDSWMDSPGHRDNILNKNYDRLGVGVAIKFNPYNLYPIEIYSTQNFC